MGARAKSFKARIQDFEADDVRAFYDNSMLRVWHLQGRARLFRIGRVQQIIKQEGDEIEKRAVLRLQNGEGEEHPLPLELNATNRDTIIGIYGTKKSAWIGKLIELYPTTCEAFGKMQECIRIRNYDPSTRQRGTKRAAQPQGQPKPEPAPVTRMQPKADPAPADPQSSGLELELDAGGNSYVDSTQDPDEPPFGSLLEDSAGNRIQ